MHRFNVLKTLFVVICLISAPHISASTDYQDIEWIELMPAEDLDALMNPPDFLATIEEGSDEDNIESIRQKTEEDDKAKRFYDALKSTTVIPEFDDKNIRIPGFIVPLASNEEQLITEFFIVPYFGACLHLPPPPPNQIIYAKLDEGVELIELSMPFWFEGNITIEPHDNDLGASAYSMAAHNVKPYDM